MGPIHRCLMIWRGRIRLNEIYMVVFLHDLLHHPVSGLLLRSPIGISGPREITSLDVDGLLEYKRNTGVSRLDLLNERNDTFLDHLSIRIREGIENESIDICIAKHLSKIRLHLAVSAAAQIENLQACIASLSRLLPRLRS